MAVTRQDWCLLALIASANALLPTATAADDAALDWLVGCWRNESGDTTERWTAPAPGLLFGSSVTVAEGKVVFFEFMQIEPGDSGYVFSAYPRGIGPNPFPSEAVGEQRISFANAEHDYPQRITYWREGARLNATISAMDGSQPNSWSYQRCAKQAD